MTKGKFSYRIIKGWILFCNFLYAIAFSRDISAILSCIINILMNILTWKKRMHKKGKKKSYHFQNIYLQSQYKYWIFSWICMYDVCTSKKRICIKFIKLVQSYYNVVTFSDVLIQTLHVCWFQESPSVKWPRQQF